MLQPAVLRCMWQSVSPHNNSVSDIGRKSACAYIFLNGLSQERTIVLSWHIAPVVALTMHYEKKKRIGLGPGCGYRENGNAV